MTKDKTVTMSRELAENLLALATSHNTSDWSSELCGALRTLLAAPIVEADGMGEAVAWSAKKPESSGAYWIRGFNLSGEFKQAALVQVVLDEDAEVLMVNLHQNTTEADTGYWYEVDDINTDFEWCGPLFASQPAPVSVRITLQQVLKAYQYADSHPHKYLRGTTNWCAAVAHELNACLYKQKEPTQ